MMTEIYWRTLCCGLVLILIFGTSSTAQAVYGGAAVPAEQGAAMVFFQWYLPRASGSCSGVLITSKAVLTAAHCVRSSAGKHHRVRAIRIGNPRGRTVHATVASIHVHPDYNPRLPQRGSDLAILMLKRAVQDHTPLRISRPTEDPKQQGERLTIRGFGITRKQGRLVQSQKLRETTQEYLSPFHCFQGPVAKMAKTRMCAASPRSGVCPGDSGAPAILIRAKEQIIVGIVSLAIDRKQCAQTATTLIRVSAFGDWIAKIAADR